MKHEFNNRAWDRFWIVLWALAILIDEDRRQDELRKKREAERARQLRAEEEWKRWLRQRPPCPAP